MNVTPARLVVALVAALMASGCATSATASPSPSASNAAPSAAASPATGRGSIVIVGRIVTMDEPQIAEALFIEDGTVVAVGTRDEVLARADDQVPVIDIGQNVAYPGFIDAHAHWIGDREYYGLDTPAEAMDAAVRRGWTSISEQWVNQERIDELTRLAADGALPLRVDAYLALNYDREFFGDWYTEREPGPVDTASGSGG
jgi:predicted amidohydrolase YtcJ